MMTGTFFFGKSIVVFSIELTWLVFAIRTQHHGLKVEF